MLRAKDLSPEQLIDFAFGYQVAAHSSVNQVRKYTGEPYWMHPCEVAEIVMTVPHTPAMIAAAHLHDTVEDTMITQAMIYEEFGQEVGKLVYWLTDVSQGTDGNRAFRKEMDRLHIAKAPPAAKTIKLADLISNTKSIKKLDPDFWVVYRLEKLALLEVLKDGGDPMLFDLAYSYCGR